jgi:hypothetical protein
MGMIRTLAIAVALLVAVTACGDTDEAGDEPVDNSTTTLPDDDGDDGGVTSPSAEPGPYPVADLSITVTHPDRDDISYRITCLGDTATIEPPTEGVDAAEACTTLASQEAADRLILGPPTDQVCTEQYGGPDEAAITGTLDDERVDTVIDRTNGCGIDDWDRKLAGVLPQALGVTG